MHALSSLKMRSHVIIATHLLQESRKQVVFLVRVFFFDVAKVAFIFLLVVDQGLDSIVAGLHTELDTLVKDCLRLIGRVNIILWQ